MSAHREVPLSLDNEEDRPRVLACDDHVDWDGGSPQHGHEDRVHLDFPPRVHHLLFTFDLLPFLQVRPVAFVSLLPSTFTVRHGRLDLLDL